MLPIFILVVQTFLDWICCPFVSLIYFSSREEKDQLVCLLKKMVDHPPVVYKLGLCFLFGETQAHSFVGCLGHLHALLGALLLFALQDRSQDFEHFCQVNCNLLPYIFQVQLEELLVFSHLPVFTTFLQKHCQAPQAPLLDFVVGSQLACVFPGEIGHKIIQIDEHILHFEDLYCCLLHHKFLPISKIFPAHRPGAKIDGGISILFGCQDRVFFDGIVKIINISVIISIDPKGIPYDFFDYLRIRFTVYTRQIQHLWNV